MKSTAKKLAVCAAVLCLLVGGTAVSASAASPLTGLALSNVTLPWNQDVPAESIDAGSYTANMLLGSSQQLSPTVRPRNTTDTVVYISDDTSILTVSSSGVVQAVPMMARPPAAFTSGLSLMSVPRPAILAKHISSSVVIRPPAEISCPARISP